jgi:hypothetical protein
LKTNNVPEPLLEKLNDIDKQVLDMSQTVWRHPALRASYLESLPLLREKFLEIIEELEQHWPEIYQQVSDQISEIMLDMDFVEEESEAISLRLSAYIDQKKDRQSEKSQPRNFPIPPDAGNVTRTLKSDMINFQTRMSLLDIAKFYRRVFIREWKLEEYPLFADDYSQQFINLIFTGLPDGCRVVVQAVDLAYSSMDDLRNVNVRSEAED